MKIYTVQVDMTGVIGRLKGFILYEFNAAFPIIHIDAADPDAACYRIACRFSEILLKQDESVETAQLIRSTFKDIKITKVFCKDEKKLR